MLVFHNFHSTTIFLIPHSPCKYPNARYNLRTYSYQLFFRMFREANPPPGVRKFIHRYMLQTLRQTMEVKTAGNVGPVYDMKAYRGIEGFFQSSAI